MSPVAGEGRVVVVGPGWVQCFEFPLLFRYCWWYVKNGIQLVKEPMWLTSEGYLTEQMETENRWKPRRPNPALSGKWLAVVADTWTSLQSIYSKWLSRGQNWYGAHACGYAY